MPTLIPLNQPLGCACPQSGLQVQVSTPDFYLLYCPRCQSVLAGRPVPKGTDGGEPAYAEQLLLDEQESAQVKQALSVVPDGPLVEVLQLVLACTLPAALRVAQQRLSQRAGLLDELQSALYGAQAEARLLTLQLIARMPEVPGELHQAALHAIQVNLSGEPLSQEVLGALTALHPLAERGQHLFDRVQTLAQSLAGASDERAVFVERIAAAVLAAIGRAQAAAKERFAAHAERLAALVQDGQLPEAQRFLGWAHPADDPADPDGGLRGRMALCEAAALNLTGQKDRSRVRTLLQWALDCAQTMASWASAGGEGQARMADVNRLRAALLELG
jgi:hypothetical protein